MRKRNKGVLFLLIGCVLLLIAGGWYMYNVVEDKSAGEQAADILDKLENVPSKNLEDEDPVITVDGETFCGRIVVEKFGIQLPVYDEWNYKRLKTAPCRYAGSITTDDIIIAAHNYKSHFGRFNQLEVGDEVQFIDSYGETHLYEVCELAILDGIAVSDMQASEWDFTLFTCTKGGKQRVTVRCNRK